MSAPLYIALDNLTGRNSTLIEKGQKFTLDELPLGVTPERIRQLCERGSIRPFGARNPVDSLLIGDNPTTEEYKEEVSRLQLIIEDQGKELDTLRKEVETLRDGFKSSATAGQNATPVPIAADNTARKRVRELEAENEKIKREALGERHRYQQQLDALNKRVTELSDREFPVHGGPTDPA